MKFPDRNFGYPLICEVRGANEQICGVTRRAICKMSGANFAYVSDYEKFCERSEQNLGEALQGPNLIIRVMCPERNEMERKRSVVRSEAEKVRKPARYLLLQKFHLL